MSDQTHGVFYPGHDSSCQECKRKDKRIAELEAIVETQKQYCANKDAVIAGLITQIKTLEGDLEVMRLQRDAKRWTKPANETPK